MALWVDKYRPNDLKELDYHDPLSQTLETLANSADMPHLLVYGPSGAGKKTRIHALLKAIYGPGAAKLALTTKTFQTPSGTKLEIQVMSSHFHMELTPSDVGNQDRVVVQEVIKEMAQAPQMATSGTAMEQQPAGHARQFKVVVLHQADMLSKDAQHGLRRTMEKYMNNMRLILCCESTSRILAPIRSRCLLVRVPAPRPEEMVQVMKRVSRQEGIQFDDAVLQRVAETSHRDMRRALLMLEASYVQNPNVIKNPDLVITEADWELFIKQLAHDVLQEQSPARLAAVRSKLYELLAHCIPAETILKHLTLNLLHRVDDGLKPVLIQQAAIYVHYFDL